MLGRARYYDANPPYQGRIVVIVNDVMDERLCALNSPYKCTWFN